MFECNFSQKSPQLVQLILLSAASSNFWMNITNIETCSITTLSYVANIIFTIRKAVAAGTS